MKTHSIVIIALISAISIAGCGGGSEESTSTEVEAAVEVTTTPPVEDTPVQATIITEELISDPSFDLSSSNELRVKLPASTSTSTRYFINICTDFSTDDKNNEININYASCKLRTEITITKQEFTLSLSASELMLIAQIWPIEEGAQPITSYWNIAEYGKQWPIEF